MTALQALAAAIRSGTGLSELASHFERFPQVLVNVPVAEKTPIERLPSVAKLVDRIQTELDGRGRVFIRYSGTEPKARVMVEGDDEDRVNRFANDIAEELKRALSGG